MSTNDENAQAAEDALVAAVAHPKRIRGDAGEVEEHSLDELIAADRHLAGKAAAGNARRGVRFARLIPPGAD
jgi:hypothetical protein